MRKAVFAALLVTLMLGVPVLCSQDKPKSSDNSSVTPLRVQVVFTEYDGEKKISSLPYTLLVNANDRDSATIRMGVRVPIESSTSAGAKEFQYLDVGTNMDGRADRMEDGRFALKLTVDRSSVYVPGTHEKPAAVGGSEISAGQPVIQQFRSHVDLLIRDGQTIQATVATDPITGHVSKVDVTVNVLK